MTRNLNLEVLLIALGVMGILISDFADSIGLGRPGFGLNQMSGLVIGALIAMLGLVKVLFSDNRTILRALTWVYVCGILFVGLMPFPFNHTHHGILLDLNIFSWRDFAVNIMGFVPLGYLLMMSFGNRLTEGRVDLFNRAIVVVGAGCLISLFLKVSQYYFIAGRHSSFMDVIANTLGTLVGVTMFLFMEHKSREERGQNTEDRIQKAEYLITKARKKETTEVK
jgi:glycopeptide antibiotics resistance protein